MTQIEILRLAYHAQVEKWKRANDERIEKPKNRYASEREKRAWQKVEEISEMIKNEEQK